MGVRLGGRAPGTAAACNQPCRRCCPAPMLACTLPPCMHPFLLRLAHPQPKLSY